MGTREGRVGCCVRLALYAPKWQQLSCILPQGAEMVSGMIYAPDEQGVIMLSAVIPRVRAL